MRVGNHQIAFAHVPREARRPSVRVLWGLPTANVFTVCVEHLDPRGHIDDVQLVFVVDRHRPRFAELPFAGAERTPHFLRLIGGRRP
jgi:hypothetical protein